MMMRNNNYHLHVGPSSCAPWWWLPSPRVVVLSPPPMVVGTNHDARVVVRAPPPSPRVHVRDVVLLVGTGALLAYGFRNALSSSPTTTAGAGVVVGTLTVALNVRRNDPDNILARLSRMAERVDTVSTRGLQDLLSGVSLELLRHEKSITSARAQSKLYDSMGSAERAFQLLSVEGRSKVDRLTVNKFGSENRPDARRVQSNADESLGFSTTMAIVTLNFAMEGSGDDAMLLPKITTRAELRQALNQISADALVSDCLLTAEILWLPEDSSETLSRDEVYADFPDLVPI